MPASLSLSSFSLRPNPTLPQSRLHKPTTTTTFSIKSCIDKPPSPNPKPSSTKPTSWVSPDWLTTLTQSLSFAKKDDSNIPTARTKLDDVSDLLGGALFLPLFKWMKEYGPVYGLAAGPRNFVVVSDPAVAKHVLRNYGRHSKGLVSEVSEFLFGSGFAIAEGQLWTSFSLSLGSNWRFKPIRELRVRVSQERSIIELGNKLGKATVLGRNRTAPKDSNVTPTYHDIDVDELPPLVSALKASAEENVASFHFPGHNRGRAAPSSLSQLIGKRPFLHDLPELPELDNLFSPEGPILDAQKKAAKLFGASETWFLVGLGGTTCGIQAAVMATCSPGDYLILPRNSHISAISAMVLSGALPKYIIPEYDFDWDIAGGVTPSQVDKAIKELEKEGRKPAAVFVTSPTYHGICSNVSEISQLCHSHGIPLIVDEAHGAHLGFHPRLPYPALHQGADIAVQSTHKVLCSLTQSSMLHMSGNIVDRERICRCLQALQSTSPSYLLLASLDAARAQLSENPKTIFSEAVELAVEAKHRINTIPGVSVLDFPSFSNFPAIDPLRLNVGVWLLGLSGIEADEMLYRDYGVVSELSGTRAITLAINLGTCKEHVQRLLSGLRNLSATFSPIQGLEERAADIGHAPFNDISTSLSPREAFFASKRKVSMKESLGEVCGELICPYPPGIPFLIPGEVITEAALNCLLQVRSKGAVISGAADPLLSSIVICSG